MKSKFYSRLTMVVSIILTFSYISFAQTTINVKINSGPDDAEEVMTSLEAEGPLGAIDIGSSDLELIFDHEPQYVGLLFRNVQIPKGSTVTNAYVQFSVDVIKEGCTDQAIALEVYGAKVANLTEIGEADYSISQHPPTTAKVAWAPESSVAVGDRGVNEQTPDIASVITEIIGLDGWAAGNNMLIIVGGDPNQTEDKNREVESFDGDPDGAPELFVTFTEGTSVDPLNADLSESIYPNPATQKITIDNPSTGIFDFEIYSINGKLVKSRFDILEPSISLDVSDFARGTYFVKITSEGRTDTHKVVLK